MGKCIKGKLVASKIFKALLEKLKSEEEEKSERDNVFVSKRFSHPLPLVKSCFLLLLLLEFGVRYLPLYPVASSPNLNERTKKQKCGVRRVRDLRPKQD